MTFFTDRSLLCAQPEFLQGRVELLLLLLGEHRHESFEILGVLFEARLGHSLAFSRELHNARAPVICTQQARDQAQFLQAIDGGSHGAAGEQYFPLDLGDGQRPLVQQSFKRETYPLAEAPKAYDRVAQGKARFRAVLTM
jgi:hypothetical protein